MPASRCPDCSTKRSAICARSRRLAFGSAPIAFGWLCDAMERDASLRDHFFAKLRMVGYGGATLSQDIYERFQALAIAATGAAHSA